jgi:F-type H+-transporting ATPase subunit epsilon
VASLRVTVVSPEREVFAGQADMVVARGVDGEVGILAGHAPMLIELAIAPVRLLQGETETGKVLVDGGFLHVTPGEQETRVDVLAEGALLPAEVDVESARRRVLELEGTGDAAAEPELARARMRSEHGTA